eukprot:scaffold4674_cov188-Amphora_coffeaeformis.AAC.7
MTPVPQKKESTTMAAAATATTTTSASTTASSSFSSGSCPRMHGICDSVLDAIGATPLIRLNHIAAHLECEILVKAEFFNAGGSVKDRIAKQMIDDAEAAGHIQPGVTTLIEPTSGNTGIGIALAAAVRGYKCIICLPEKMSKEKVDVLKALGAEIIRTPTEAAYDAPDSHISVARRLRDEIPHGYILDQYGNPSNPVAHYDGTGREIWQQCHGRIDMLVAGAGTGGTLTGTAKRLKEYNPHMQIVGVDPEGSILAVPDSLNDKKRLEAYHVEGIGYDVSCVRAFVPTRCAEKEGNSHSRTFLMILVCIFIPDVLDRSLVDKWYKSNDTESLVMMRRLIRDEGLLCGGSSGAAVAAALEAAKSLKKGQRCVVILPDSVRNYMTKALSDDWMGDHGFIDGDLVKMKKFQSWWATKRVCDLPISTPLTITSDVLCKHAIALMKQEGFDMVPVLDDGHVVGVVTEGNMTTRVLSGRCSMDASVAEAGVIYKTFHKFTMNTTLAEVASALDHDPFVLIVTEQRCYSGQTKKRKPGVVAAGNGSSSGGGGDIASDVGIVSDSCQAEVVHLVSGIVSRIDLLDFISSSPDEKEEK